MAMTARRVAVTGFVVVLVLGLGCCLSGAVLVKQGPAAMRRLTGTRLVKANTVREPPVPPPPGLFELVKYDAPLGKNWAYVTPVQPGPRRAAVLYLTGGFTWGIDEGAWDPAPPRNDQSGRAFREAGLVVMRPSLRGTHDNPGGMECFFGEVDDVVAAGRALAARADVDPDRIYVVGHSTGASMALLAAETSSLFRGVVAFGAAGTHAKSCLPAVHTRNQEVLRSPELFSGRLRMRTLLIEGSQSPNASFLRSFKAPNVVAVEVPGLDHFSVLGPASDVVARVLVADTGPSASFTVTAREIQDRALERERDQCKRARSFEAPAAAPWVDGANWPQLVLTNAMQLHDRKPTQGAASFLLETKQGVVLATAAQLTKVGVDPALPEAALLDGKRFTRAVDSWSAFPRTREAEAIDVVGLAEPAVHGDWLLLSVGAVPVTFTPLQLAKKVPKVGAQVYLLGCPYSEPECVQHVYRGVVKGLADDRLRYSVEPPVETRGFSGGPLLDAQGHVVGVFSQLHQLKEGADGRATEAESDVTLLTDALQCDALGR